MDVKKFIVKGFLGRMPTKLLQLSLVIFVGSILGAKPTLWGFLGAFLYYLSYFSVYFYNDLRDYEKDKRKKFVYSSKALVKGYATKEDYLRMLAFSPLLVLITTLWDPVLGTLVTTAIILNHIRTDVQNLFARQILLTIIQLINFEGFWQAMYSSLLPIIFLPLFLAISFAYSTLHAFYKMESIKKEKIKESVKRKETKGLISMFLIFLILSLPALLLSFFHFASILVAVFVISLPSLISIKKSEKEVEKAFNSSILAASLLLLFSAWIYVSIGYPFNKAVPFFEEIKAKLGNSYTAAAYLDELQQKMIERAFYGVSGFKSRTT